MSAVGKGADDRCHIELNLRYLKAQMDLAQLEAKSPDMARKEWLAGLLAYNLILAAQLCAALQKAISPPHVVFCLRSPTLGMLVAPIRPHPTPSRPSIGQNTPGDGPLPAPPPPQATSK